MNSVNKKTLVICRFIYAKKIQLLKNVAINISQRHNNLIVWGLLQAVNYIKPNVGYENKNKIFYKSSIN